MGQSMRVRYPATLGTSGKMPPGTTCWSIPTYACQTGAKLASDPRTTCHYCYAVPIEGRYPSVLISWARNLEGWQDAAATLAGIRQWAHQLAAMIEATNASGLHRWFVGGDLQGPDMLDAIVQVARLTPEIRHWLPTRENHIVHRWLSAGGEFPPNLVVRFSSPLIDQPPLISHRWTSTVHRETAPAGHTCPATVPGAVHNCRAHNCTACWDPRVPNTSYQLRGAP